MVLSWSRVGWVSEIAADDTPVCTKRGTEAARFGLFVQPARERENEKHGLRVI